MFLFSSINGLKPIFRDTYTNITPHYAHLGILKSPDIVKLYILLNFFMNISVILNLPVLILAMYLSNIITILEVPNFNT